MLVFLQKWWYTNGWFYIIVLSCIVLFVLWILYARKETASTNVNFDNVVQMILKQPNAPPGQQDFDNVPPRTIRPVPELDNIQPKRSKGEQICFDVLLEYTGKKFEKIRPDWLVNPITREPMEIDLYNDDLKLGVEYNGKQHDEYNEFMHQGSRDKFRNQQYRDYLKNDICKKRGVYLITVSHNIKHHDIKSYLSTELKKYIDSFKH